MRYLRKTNQYGFKKFDFRKSVNETITGEREAACWRLNETKKDLERRLTAYVTK